MTPADAPLTPDALADHWSLRLLPRPLRPYGRLMRLERPIGWHLLLWPCVFSSLLASSALSGPVMWAHLALFLVGAVIMRSAGCTLNDIIDRDVDSQVARTAARPIPSGEISARRALAFLVLLLFLGLLVLVQFNGFTILLGASALVLVGVYPFMKRVTNWPQVVLGLAFSWGALVGWAAQTASLGLPALLLYLACVAWIVGYDTIYAYQDLEDDALAGVGSTAQVLGDTAARPFLALCNGVFVVAAGAALWAAEVSWPAWAGLAAAALHLGWQVIRFDPDDAGLCLALFKSNTVTGALLSVGLLGSVFL